MKWIHTQHAQIQAGWCLHWPWHQSYFFLWQAFHSRCSYLLRVVGIGEEGWTETHEYSFGEIRYSVWFSISWGNSHFLISLEPLSSHVFTDNTLLSALIKITNELHFTKSNQIFLVFIYLIFERHTWHRCSLSLALSLSLQLFLLPLRPPGSSGFSLTHMFLLLFLPCLFLLIFWILLICPRDHPFNLHSLYGQSHLASSMLMISKIISPGCLQKSSLGFSWLPDYLLGTSNIGAKVCLWHLSSPGTLFFSHSSSTVNSNSIFPIVQSKIFAISFYCVSKPVISTFKIITESNHLLLLNCHHPGLTHHNLLAILS